MNGPSTLPHHRLRAYGTALEFLRAVRAAAVLEIGAELYAVLSKLVR